MATPKGGYYAADGKRIPSVTTILGRFKDSSGLIKWAYRQGIEHQLLRSNGQPAPNDLYDVTQKAADAGTIAHDLIEQHLLQGQEQDWKAFVAREEFKHYSDNEQGVVDRAMNGYAQFKKWIAQTNLKITHTELSLKSEKYRFGGTLDGAGVDANGDRVLIDWKTSNAVYEDYLVQLAAYALLLEECRPELNPKGFHLLRVAKESADFAHYYWGELDVQKKQFLLMRELYDLAAITKKRVG